MQDLQISNSRGGKIPIGDAVRYCWKCEREFDMEESDFSYYCPYCMNMSKLPSACVVK